MNTLLRPSVPLTRNFAPGLNLIRGTMSCRYSIQLSWPYFWNGGRVVTDALLKFAVIFLFPQS